MAQSLSPQARSKLMAKVKSAHTGPELCVRRSLHRLGYRFRLHTRDLPGRPDIVFTRKKKVIFVHGCFWHMHDCRKGLQAPKTNADFWQAKRMRNVERDQVQIQRLQDMGWESFIIWECEIPSEGILPDGVRNFLDDPKNT